MWKNLIGDADTSTDTNETQKSAEKQNNVASALGKTPNNKFWVLCDQMQNVKKSQFNTTNDFVDDCMGDLPVNVYGPEENPGLKVTYFLSHIDK